MQLDADLSKEKQNLIFARNGSGKSFLARSLRLLDQHNKLDLKEDEISNLLVSEESPKRTGYFQILEDTNCVGAIHLDANSKKVQYSQPDYIFHVFSEDYVDFHLRQKSYVLNGEITHEIIVGKDNDEVEEKQKSLDQNRTLAIQKKSDLNKDFEKEKNKLQKVFQINGSLGAFKALKTDVYFAQTPLPIALPSKDIATLQVDYTSFKNFPGSEELPKFPEWEEVDIDVTVVSNALSTITSASSVADNYKKKITSDPNFFKSGVERYRDTPSECPFCTQTLNHAASDAISAYIEYFKDAEALAKAKITQLRDSVQDSRKKINQWQVRCLSAKERYNRLKAYFPSLSEKQFADVSENCASIDSFLKSIENQLSSKLKQLDVPIPMPEGNLDAITQKLESISAQNNALCSDLEKLAGDLGSERRKIQNEACDAFKCEYLNNQKASITEIRNLTLEEAELSKDLAELKKTQGDKADARSRVADTFAALLKRFFGSKYRFDKKSFKVTRDEANSLRQIDRTLSDGEKAVMAFCFFIAQSHLRVETNDDYEKLFFVFDDPVTSMSFDYVYTIVQTLKYLRIGNGGEIEFNPKAPYPRPRMLILTHSNYFYNVASSNGAIKKSGLFQLVPSSNEHKISCQKGFATPHHQQLVHVLAVSEKIEAPDYRTPNCIRSVIEGMWKFCRPDFQDFGAFTEFLINDCEIEIKSVLVNDLSHGGKFDDAAHQEDDIVLAAQEAIRVVKRFAEGQLKNA